MTSSTNWKYITCHNVARGEASHGRKFGKVWIGYFRRYVNGHKDGHTCSPQYSALLKHFANEVLFTNDYLPLLHFTKMKRKKRTLSSSSVFMIKHIPGVVGTCTVSCKHSAPYSSYANTYRQALQSRQ